MSWQGSVLGDDAQPKAAPFVVALSSSLLFLHGGRWDGGVLSPSGARLSLPHVDRAGAAGCHLMPAPWEGLGWVTPFVGALSPVTHEGTASGGTNSITS